MKFGEESKGNVVLGDRRRRGCCCIALYLPRYMQYNTTSSGMQQGGEMECLHEERKAAGTATARPERPTMEKEPRRKQTGKVGR